MKREFNVTKEMTEWRSEGQYSLSPLSIESSQTSTLISPIEYDSYENHPSTVPFSKWVVVERNSPESTEVVSIPALLIYHRASYTLKTGS